MDTIDGPQSEADWLKENLYRITVLHREAAERVERAKRAERAERAKRLINQHQGAYLINTIDGDRLCGGVARSLAEYLQLHRLTMRRADLSNIILNVARLDWGEFSYADMTGTALHQVSFDHANMFNTILRDTNLYNVSFVNARLINADFTNAHFCGVDFTGANLSGAVFTNANRDGAIFKDTITDNGNFGIKWGIR